MSDIATWREIVEAYDSIHLLNTLIIVHSNEILQTLRPVVQERGYTALIST